MVELPSVHNFLALLEKCRKKKELLYASQLHVEACSAGLESHKLIGNHLIQSFVECRSIAHGRKVFNTVGEPNVHSWTSLMLASIQSGDAACALSLYQEMQSENLMPSTHTHVAFLKACTRLKYMERGKEIHARVACEGIETDLYVGSILVDMYAKCGALLEARHVFDKLPARNIVLWSVLFGAYVDNKQSQEALICFEQMKGEGLSPDPVTFICILRACGNIRADEEGKRNHISILQKGFEKDPLIGNTLIDMYAKCGLFMEASDVLEKLPSRDVVSWTALITGYAEHGLAQEALECFMKMQVDGMSPDAAVFSCVIKSCTSTGALDRGREIHREAARKELVQDLFVGSTLIDMYAKCGSLSEAQKVFDELSVRDAVAWNALIAGYAEHGPSEEALNWFEQMPIEGISQSATTFVCAMRACGNIGAIDKGQELHTQIMQLGLERQLSVGGMLVDMYAKLGYLAEGREVFNELQIQDVASWNALIKGYGMNHKGKVAIEVFKEMQEKGVKPDSTTFTCLLNACSHASLADKGQEFFEMMTREFNIVPTLDHFNCMVDLLARVGHLYKAERLIKSMPCSPSMDMWRALLSACKTHMEVELGFVCFEQLVKMNPKCAASYVLMGDIYASKGRWDDVKKIEDMRTHAGAMKTPASAFIKVNNRVHEFVVGTNQQCGKISELLEILNSQMEEKGYVPDVDTVSKSEAGSLQEAASW